MRKLYILFYIVQGFFWSAQPGYSKPLYNGVSFIGMDGYDYKAPTGFYNEKLCYVLDNQDVSPIKDRLQNTFSEYQKAGVNLVRVFVTVGIDFGCNPNEYAEPLYNGVHPDGSPPPWAVTPDGPQLRTHRIQTMNDFIVKAAGYGIKTELLFMTPAREGTDPNTKNYYSDPYPYNDDKAWIATWMQGLNPNLKNIALIGLAPEIKVQSKAVVNGRHYLPPFPADLVDEWRGYAENNALYAETMWTWFKGAFPSVPATVEFLSVGWNETVPAPPGEMPFADPQLVTDLANWSGTNLPGQSYITMETYFYLPVQTASRNDYLSTAKGLLSHYFSSSYYQSKHTPLWIDEMGHPICAPVLDACPATEVNQENYFSGMLNASEQYPANQLGGRVAWVGSNDAPDTKYGEVYGLISGYTQTHQLMFRPAWKTLSSFYKGNPLVVPAASAATLSR